MARPTEFNTHSNFSYDDLSVKGKRFVDDLLTNPDRKLLETPSGMSNAIEEEMEEFNITPPVWSVCRGIALIMKLNEVHGM